MGAVMLMFWNEKLVILQVPKTGSTALEAALAPRASMHISHPPQMRHLTYRRYAYRFAPFFENFDPTPMEVLAVLRNPVNWVGSWYRYYLGSKFEGTDHSTLGLTFSDFVDAVITGSDAPYAQIGTQSAMIAPPPEGCAHPLRLFAYEDQPRFMAFLSQRFQTKIACHRMNQSKPVDLEISADLRAAIETHFAEDLSAWQRLHHPPPSA